MSDQFAFLRQEWPEVHEAAAQAAAMAHADPRTSCVHARRALELAVHWAFKFDGSLCMPYDDSLSALIHEPSFRAAAGHGVFQKARLIKNWGNDAVHNRPIKLYDSLNAVRELFHVSYWFARTYARGARPAPSLTFDANALPKTSPLPKQTVEQLQKQEAELKAKDEKLSVLLADKSALDDELKRLRAELAEAKKARVSEPDTHDYSEAETRDQYIDLLLKEAGWPLDQARDREFEVAGMPNAEKKGFVDYVLWGDDGKPLAVVEAKRTKKSAEIGQQQAKLYADCLEQQYGQRPVIFYTNGYEHWLWDDVSYPPRPVQGFYKKSELALLMQRRTSKKSLATATVNNDIVDRFYQIRAIRRIGEATLHQASEESAGLGLFVRSLVGLDREAAKLAFGAFLDEKTFSASQIEFVNLIVNHLTEQGVMSAKLLYESPFTDIAPTGPDGLFDAAQVERLMTALQDVEMAALGRDVG